VIIIRISTCRYVYVRKEEVRKLETVNSALHAGRAGPNRAGNFPYNAFLYSSVE
jgi:hypothetical protein